MIAVFGDIIIDEYIYGTSTRLSPEAPVPVVKFSHSETKMGGAANVFNNINSLSKFVQLCSSVTTGVLPRKQRVFSGTHYVTRIDYEDEDTNWYNEYPEAEVYVISDYDKGCFRSLDRDFFKGRKVIVDPKRYLNHYQGMWCVKPNRKEFEAYIGKWTTDEELSSLMYYALEGCQFEHLIVTLGEEGVAYRTRDKFMKIPSQAVEVADVTGAGDTFTAVLAYATFMGYSMEDAIIMANRGAGAAVKHLGCYTVKKEDLGFSHKKMVFTNGCFDLLHQGHLKYLKASKALGDELIVGLNSDASVRRLKGNDRPVNDQATRKAVLESLKFVDKVIIFDEDTPLELIKRLRPSIITKGGDYIQDDVVGVGYAEVVILPYEDGVSTTKTIERIKNDAA